MRQWHFARVWFAVLFEDMPIEHASAALLRAVSPAEAMRLVTISTSARSPVYARITTDAPWERDQALALAVIAAAREAGLDTASACRELATAYGALPGILAVAYLIEHRSHTRPEDLSLVVQGVSAARCAEPLRSLLAALPKASLSAILHQTMVGTNVLRVLDLCLDEVILKKLVASATGPWAKQFRDQILAMLSKHRDAPGVVEAIAAIRQAP
jgi:hypothetical protein